MRNVFTRDGVTYVKTNLGLVALPELAFSYSAYPKDVFYAHPDANSVSYPALPFINKEDGYERLSEGLTWYILTGDKLHEPSVAVLDIETEGLTPEKDKILMIGLGFENETIILTGEEEDIIPLCFALLEAEDPDIIAGHNISEFDVPFLKKRYRLLQNTGQHLPEPPIYTSKRKFRVGMEVEEIDVHYISNSLCVDTRTLLRRHDIMTGLRLRSFSLKYAVSALELSDRKFETFMQQETAEDRILYLTKDLRDTRRLFNYVTEWWFMVTKFIPVSLDDLYTGTGSLIDILLQRLLVPLYPRPVRQREAEPYRGAKVDISYVGYIENVYALDVVSMYPSIMRKHTRPYYDKRNVFAPLVGALMDLRLTMKKENNPVHKALKIVINSMYGYLGSSFSFADAKEAEKVTATGRKIISEIEQRIRTFATVCELDTDGIYFSCPETDEPKIASIIQEFAEQGYELEKTKYKAGLFVKKKNYALWKEDGTLVLRGNSLQSRRDDDIVCELVQRIVEAYRTSSPSDAIKQLWKRCIDDYIYYKLQNMTGEWKRRHYMPVERDENPSNQTKAERLFRLQKVFGRFDTLKECNEIATKSKNVVLSDLFGQQTLLLEG